MLTKEQQKGSQHDPCTENSILISLTWVVRHMGSIGNEAADKLARAATKFLSEPVPYPGMESVWPGLGVYIHPVVPAGPRTDWKRKRAD
jgi:hypothetical protein